MIARTAIRVNIADDYNTYGIICEFEEMEGWPKMDGSSGFNIISSDEFEISSSDLTIIEQKAT